MPRCSLDHLSDSTLLRALVARDRTTTAALLAHIAAVDGRQLYLPAAYPPMFAYCVGELRFSEGAAFKRIQAARAARRFPAIRDAIAEGRLHLSGVVLLAAHLTEDTAEELLAAATHKSKSEIERLLAERFPKSEVLAWVEPIPAAQSDPAADLSAPGRIEVPAPAPAVESRPRVQASVFTDTLNLQAIRLAAPNLRPAYANGANLTARENMLHASCLAGMAFSNTQNGLDHALALAIGGKFHLPHGLLTAFILPWVMEFNLIAAPKKFIEIARAFGEKTKGVSEIDAARLSVKAVKGLLDDVGISYKLSSYGVPREEFPALAKAAVGAVRLISNNPRAVTGHDVIGILETNY